MEENVNTPTTTPTEEPLSPIKKYAATAKKALMGSIVALLLCSFGLAMAGSAVEKAQQDVVQAESISYKGYDDMSSQKAANAANLKVFMDGLANLAIISTGISAMS